MTVNTIPIVNDPKHLGSKINFNNVPTLDSDVRIELRKHGEPITLFGEDPAERRERLLRILQEKPHTNFEFAQLENQNSEDESMSDDEDDDEEFYTPGSEELEKARKDILKFSVDRAIVRVQKQKDEAKSFDFLKVLKHRRHINQLLSEYELSASSVLKGNARAISAVRINPEGIIACGSWDGHIYFLNSDEYFNHIQAGRLGQGYHSEKVGGLDWHPTDSTILASGGQEGSLNIWRYTESEVLKPHTRLKDASEGRIPKVAFHADGIHLANTSFDQTWKLWDINKELELLEQEGHSKEVFACAFHPDGSLIATGDLDGIGRVWDLRSGRSIAILDAHVQGIYSMDWSPNGFHLASASGDCSVKIWDLRKLTSVNGNTQLFLIPAHSKLVSEVKFFKGQGSPLVTKVTDENDKNPSEFSACGTFLATSSYDGTVKVWSADNWINVKTLQGHNDKVMSCDISADGSYLISSGWDRTVKTWLKI